ncbi:hypothetical protein CLOM_g19042 [Closterium sp. NIES-68]|nr:hypothetical protein CLOM_g19042 [Closterium sp. NIES-68]GJP84632.1 hypothetical protein CLOP_g14685 [Closterium sp. NIES-67]
MTQSAFARQSSSHVSDVMEPFAFATATSASVDATTACYATVATESPVTSTTTTTTTLASSDATQSIGVSERPPHHRRSRSGCDATSLWSSSGRWSVKGGSRGSGVHHITSSTEIEDSSSCLESTHLQPPPRGEPVLAHVSSFKHWSADSPSKSPVAQPTVVRGHRRFHSISEIDGSLFEDFAAKIREPGAEPHPKNARTPQAGES